MKESTYEKYRHKNVITKKEAKEMNKFYEEKTGEKNDDCFCHSQDRLHFKNFFFKWLDKYEQTGN